MAKEATRVRRRERKNIVSGVAHVNASFNNTMITITDAQGNCISWSSAGTMGFKGSRKSTPYAAQMAAEDAGRKAMEHGMRTREVNVAGPGSGFQYRPRECDPKLPQTAHRGGMNVALADGSVRFVRRSVSPATWYAANTPADEDLGADW